MIPLVWNVSVLIHSVLQFAPTNLLAAAIRSPRGQKWGCAVMLLAPVYFFAAEVCMNLIDDGAPGALAFVTMLMIWNGLKMLWLGPISLVLLVRRRIRSRIHARRERRLAAGQASAVTAPAVAGTR